MQNQRKSKKIENQMLVNGGRLQPQAVDAERAVLGALMIDREAFMDISEILTNTYRSTYCNRKVSKNE